VFPRQNATQISAKISDLTAEKDRIDEELTT